MAENPIFSKLKKDLGFILKGKDSNNTNIIPVITNDKGKKVPVNFAGNGNSVDPMFKKIWDWWVSTTYDKPDSFKNRYDRYNDMSYAYYNEPIIASTVELLSDETIQSDSDQEAIEVFAKNKSFEKAIKEFFINIGLNKQKLSAISHDIALYGDSFLSNSVMPKEGITKIYALSPYTVTQRIEFTLARAIEQYSQSHTYFGQFRNKMDSINQLYKMYTDKSGSQISEMFESFLFGFIIGEKTAVPPWTVTHFRRYSNESEFYPFGKSPYIHAIAPYRKYASSQNLVEMARIASFPIRHMQVSTDENMTEAEQWEAVQMTQELFGNLGVTNMGKDEFSLNDIIWTPEGLLSVDVIENKIDLKDIKDVELLQNELLIAMRVPKGYIPIHNDNSWGDSGKSLVQQSKMFARLVYQNQQTIIAGLIDMIKTHFAIRGEFEDEVFEISMPFPVVEESSDRMRMKNDSIRLAKDILDNLGQSLGLDRGEALPVSVVKDVFSRYSFLDDEEINNWIKQYQEEKEANNEDSMVERKKTLLNRYEETKDNFLRDTYFNNIAPNSALQEGIRGKRHYILSTSQGHSNENYLYEFLRNQNKQTELLLKEGKDNISYSSIGDIVKLDEKCINFYSKDNTKKKKTKSGIKKKIKKEKKWDKKSKEDN